MTNHSNTALSVHFEQFLNSHFKIGRKSYMDFEQAHITIGEMKMFSIFAKSDYYELQKSICVFCKWKGATGMNEMVRKHLDKVNLMIWFSTFDFRLAERKKLFVLSLLLTLWFITKPQAPFTSNGYGNLFLLVLPPFHLFTIELFNKPFSLSNYIIPVETSGVPVSPFLNHAARLKLQPQFWEKSASEGWKQRLR